MNTKRKPSTRIVGVPVPVGTYRQIKAVAAKEGRTVANLARLLIEQGLQRRAEVA